jgi:PAS domain S-box-containing protein
VADPTPVDAVEAGDVNGTPAPVPTESEPPLILTELAQTSAQACGMPFGIIRLSGPNREWVMARFGAQFDDTPYGERFCATVLASPEPVVVEDLTEDARFADDPMVSGAPYLRSAAGVPIPSDEDPDVPIGALCVFDTVPRSFHQTSLLVRVARLVSGGLAIRKALASRDATLSELARVHANLQAILDGVGDLICSIDPDGRLKYANRAWRERLGYEGEVSGIRLTDVIHPDHHDACIGIVNRALGGWSGRLETVFVTQAGEELEVEGAISSQTDQDGSVSTRGVFRDISARKRMERDRDAAFRMEREARKALQGQNLRLAELDDIRREFVSITSHELRTPLTSIRGYCEILLDDPTLDPDIRERIAVIERNAGRLARLTSDLHVVAQGAADIHLNRETVNLDRIAQEAIAAAAPISVQRNVTIQSDLSQTPVIGDAARLGQIVDNLVSNALKFSSTGGVVTVRVAPTGATGTVSVTDSGMGIPAEEQSQLFERFFRTEGAREGGVPGTGIGLTVVKRLVDAHGGRVSVQSAPGVGTTFRVELPRG